MYQETGVILRDITLIIVPASSLLDNKADLPSGVLQTPLFPG